MGKIKDLAPTLVAAGIDRKKIKNACVPRKAAPPPPEPTIAPKRVQAAYTYILEGKNDEEVCRLACVPLELVWTIQDELKAIKKDLSKETPVEYNSDVELDEDETPAKQ
jgi:hypothetical protein